MTNTDQAPAPGAGTDHAPVEWTAAGQVITYTSDRPNRWCREGWAISDEHGRFYDTYWMSMSDAHAVTAAELATAEHQFWLDDFRELDRHRPGAPDEWAKYAPADRRRIPSQHGLQARYFVRHGADVDLPTQVENAEDALERAERDLRSARARRDAAAERLHELQERLMKAAVQDAPTPTAAPAEPLDVTHAALRAPGHALHLEWSGEHGAESTSTGTCKCGGWEESASSQDEVRSEYRFHLRRVLGHVHVGNGRWTLTAHTEEAGRG